MTYEPVVRVSAIKIPPNMPATVDKRACRRAGARPAEISARPKLRKSVMTRDYGRNGPRDQRIVDIVRAADSARPVNAACPI
jgi:hypothetical protein